MPVVAVIGHEDSEYEPAPTTGRVDGKYVPYGYAGTIVDTGTVLCAGCATEEELADGPMIAGNEEADYLDDVHMLGGGDS
jgi:hypothetical protein